MQIAIFSLCLCLLNIVEATSMYSFMSNSKHSEILPELSFGNSSCTPGPGATMKNCHIPTLYKTFFVERKQLDFDEYDSANTDGDCCCPTKVAYLDTLNNPYLINTKGENKKLAFGDCQDVSPFLLIGLCSKETDNCGKCHEVKRQYSLLIEENGEPKFDTFQLSSHCACTG